MDNGLPAYINGNFRLEQNYHVTIKNNCALSFVCDIIIIVLALIVFSSIANASFICFLIALIICTIVGFEMYYYMQCFSEKNRYGYTWHRKVEFNPIVFLFLRCILLLLIIVIAILRDNIVTIPLYDILCNVSFSTTLEILVSIAVFAVILYTTISQVKVHRDQSVVSEEVYNIVKRNLHTGVQGTPGVTNVAVGTPCERNAQGELFWLETTPHIEMNIPSPRSKLNQ